LELAANKGLGNVSMYMIADKVIYSERSQNPMAAKIVAEETDKMIIAMKQLLWHFCSNCSWCDDGRCNGMNIVPKDYFGIVE